MSLQSFLKAARESGATKAVKPLLEGRLKAYLSHRATLPNFRRQGVWHPSEMSSVCVRQKVIARTLPQRALDTIEHTPPPPWLQSIFDVGHWLHRGYQEEYLGPAQMIMGHWRCSRCHHTEVGFMPKGSCPECQWTSDPGGLDLTPGMCLRNCEDGDRMERDSDKVLERGGCNHCKVWGRWEYREFNLQLEIPIPTDDGPPELLYGHIDGVSGRLSDEISAAIVDIKTTNPTTFASLTTVKQAYYDQMQAYLAASSYLAKKYPELGLPEEGLEWAIVLFVNKSPMSGMAHRKELLVKRDREYAAELLSDPVRMRAALAADDDDELPERLPECKSVRSPRAKGCPFKHACFESTTKRHIKLRSEP